MDTNIYESNMKKLQEVLNIFVSAKEDFGESFLKYLIQLRNEQNSSEIFTNLLSKYSDTSKPVNSVRRKVIEKIQSEGSVTKEDLEKFKEEELSTRDKNVFNSRSDFSILYGLYYYSDNKKEEILNFLREIISNLIQDANMENVKGGEGAFDYNQHFGTDDFYFGIFNKSHSDRQDAKQFRVQSIGKNQIRVGLFYNNNFVNGRYKLYDIATVTYQDLLGELVNNKTEILNDVSTPHEETIILSTEKNKMIDLNTILYGVPGTGKTYNTINYAVAAIEGKSIDDICKEDRNIVKKRYDHYKSEGQIVFTTFHQSFGYEDFIEGIKAKVDENKNINYDVESGIFKNLCEVADSESNIIKASETDIDVDNVQIFKMSLGEAGKEDDIYDYCMENNVIATGFGDMDFTDLKKGASSKEIKEFINENNPNEESKFTADAMFRFKTWMNVGDLVIISKGNLYFRAIGKVTSEYYYDENSSIDYKHFRKVEWLLKDVNIPVERINNKNFSQQSIYNLKDNTKQTSLKLDEIKKLIGVTSNPEKRNYVLIIDEINRGNISKIFGELITLIEPNKRVGEPEQIKVKLPYSQKEFGVPNNLYIIGTMNTADRSIALIDLALRRRFTFKEIEPNSQLLEGINIEGINIATLFEKINKRIEFLYDRDHLLGHAYFLPLESEPTLKKLNKIMLDKIIPLLQEYFHDDREKIQLVLGKGLINSEEVTTFNILGTDNTDYEDQTKYSINLNPSIEDYNI